MGTRILVALIVMAAVALPLGCQQRRLERLGEDLHTAQSERDAAIAERNDAQAQAARAQSTVQVVTEYVDRVQIVRQRGATITREVPVHVTPSADAACTVPVGFVRLHNAAASDTPLEPRTGAPDAPAVGITLSDVASVTSENYATCHQLRAQVTSLQRYIATQPGAVAPDQAPAHLEERAL